jgi:GT2 family glycosyltransferase
VTATEQSAQLAQGNRVEAADARAALAELGLGRGWLRRGLRDRALQHFRRAIEIDPDLEGAHVQLARTLGNERRLQDAIGVCEDGLRRFPEQALLHKHLITALTELHGHEAALARHGLRRVDDRPIDIYPGEVLGCLVVRNEARRLPWFLAEHRRLGVSTFLAVDNGSTDGTLDLLRDQPDVHLWETSNSFIHGNYGSAWFEVLLSRFGLGHWIVMLDADEILSYPGCEHTSVRELCNALDRAGKRAMSGVMIDMYGAGSIAETRYVPGDDFLDHCRYFDRRTHHQSFENAGPFSNQTFRFGGARTRVFGSEVDYLVTKTPLVRYEPDVVLAGGQHWTSHPSERIAHDGCAVLHFKYFSSLVDRATADAERAERSFHWRLQLEAYRATLERHRDLRLYEPSESIAFEGSTQLVELGIVDEAWRGGRPRPSVPRIAPRASESACATGPSWSVMLTVYDRLHTLERALRSVLAQVRPGMQIAVVADRHDAATSAQLRALIESIPGALEQVELHELPSRVGHPQIFNECLDRARGDWIHILHDDDWVHPGFYAAMEEGIEQAPDVGAAFARQELQSGKGRIASWVERESAGVIDKWLDRIAAECRVEFSAMTVRRSVFEELGGFCREIGSAFDWEMWQRIAVHHRVWFDPRPLVVICRDGTAETDRLAWDGNQVLDGVAAGERARRHFPPDRADRLHRRARERFALHGLELAAVQIRAGRHESAQRNIAAALEASDSPRVVAALRLLLDENQPLLAD